MSDIRVSMREFRFLEEKRKLAPLTPAEEQRWIELGRTLGIFELAEANPDDVAEVDPSDVVLIEAGPDKADGTQASGPADNNEPAPLAQSLETSPAQDTTTSVERPSADDAAAQSEAAPPEPITPLDLPASNGIAERSEAAPPMMGEDGANASSTAAPVETSADEGDTWNGLAAAPAESPPVIDLSLLDATPGRGSAILSGEMPSSEGPGAAEAVDASAANGAAVQPAAAEAASDMPEPWGGQAAAQAFPKTSPQFRNPIRRPSSLVLEGERRVVVHLLDGQVKRGAVQDLEVAAPTVPLLSAGGVENIPADRLTAIFFMRAPGSRKPDAVGQKIRLTFQDGRQVIGFSTDYQTGDPGFFLIPADLKTNTDCIFVYRWSVYSIAEE